MFLHFLPNIAVEVTLPFLSFTSTWINGVRGMVEKISIKRQAYTISAPGRTLKIPLTGGETMSRKSAVETSS